MRTESLFYPKTLLARARANAARYPWAAQARDEIVAAAQPWLRFSDGELWSLMYGNTLRRSWMVWSNGHCPACQGGVPMYNWRIDGHARPWKVQCPLCGEVFPKNDFHAYYRSGLNEHGIFEAARADRALLFNSEHPDAADPLYTFGVDDGNGYRDGEHIWWFVATYLIYGQWKQLVHGGICRLAAAYAMSGDRGYAHRAGVLLDRVADLYPSFDFKEEGVMYEGPAHAGYVSTWHDACEETREMALAFDQVGDSLAEDHELAAFLHGQAVCHGLANAKATPADVLRNIEDGILRHPLANPDRIRTNYPRREIALIVLRSVLDADAGRGEVARLTDEMVTQATAVDGVTGEKGLAGYSAYVIHGLAVFLEQFARIDPSFLPDLLRRHPSLSRTYRFHMDTWCAQEYYPQSGDTGAFGRKCERYAGAPFLRRASLLPSMFSLFYRLYELTGDVGYVQVLYHENGRSTDGLPHDLFEAEPKAFQARVARLVEAAGADLDIGSVNKPSWHIGLLRAGQGGDRRTVWLDYDSGGRHGHRDGMNLGIFAKGLDLIPDYGYPPVQYGGWQGERFSWYLSTAAHNTVVVDGRDQTIPADGGHTLWGAGPTCRAIRAAGEALYDIRQYERTVVMVDVSPADSYVLDVFRVAGGSDHGRFLHSHFASLETCGLALQPGEEYGHGAQMRGFQCDPQPRAGWWADWRVDDRFGYAAPGAQIHLRYTDVTLGAQVSTAEGWIAMDTSSYEQAWIPRVLVRRRAESAELISTFVGVFEPYEGQPFVSGVRRLALTGEGSAAAGQGVAAEVRLADGRRDLILAAGEDGKGARAVLAEEHWAVRLDGQLCVVRQSAEGQVERVVLWGGRAVHVGPVAVELAQETGFAEVEVRGGQARVVAGAGALLR